MKSILIIDTPKICLDCPLCYTEELFTYRCKVSEEQVEAKEIYIGCPLKPLPEIPYHMEFDEYYGYEQCLKDILGG